MILFRILCPFVWPSDSICMHDPAVQTEKQRVGSYSICQYGNGQLVLKAYANSTKIKIRKNVITIAYLLLSFWMKSRSPEMWRSADYLCYFQGKYM